MKPCDAVLLDMDGTIVDAFGPIIYALNSTLEEFGLATLTEEEVIRHTGKGECSMISLFGDQRDAAGKRFLEFHDRRLFDIKPLPSAAALLSTLHQLGIKVAIVTSKSQVRADQQLAFLGWDQYIDVVIGLKEDRRQKPDPHTLELACAALEVTPDHVFMIGDGTADMKAALQAGVPTIVGISNSFSSGELLAAGATTTFKDLQETWTWLQTLIH